jgi:hypothetical protein
MGHQSGCAPGRIREPPERLGAFADIIIARMPLERNGEPEGPVLSLDETAGFGCRMRGPLRAGLLENLPITLGPFNGGHPCPHSSGLGSSTVEQTQLRLMNVDTLHGSVLALRILMSNHRITK